MSELREIGGNCVGIEVAKQGILAVCIDAAGQVIGEKSTEIWPEEPSTAQVISFATSLRSTFGDFARIGLAVPGLIDRGANTVAYSAHFPEHSGSDLCVEIEKATGIKTFVENDANAAAYGEFKLGAGRAAENMFYATVGEGVGGCFIFNGAVWRGVRGFAGELGYVPINSEGTRLEEVASSANIIRRTRNRFRQDHTSSLGDIDQRNIKISDIIAAAAAEDDFAILMLERTGTYLGTAIATVINLTNIERVVIGGDVIRGQRYAIDAIVARARELSFGPSFASTTILEGELGANASAVGAALLARES
jgi:glucokinase